MAGNIMNQNFGSDDEDEEDFNPEPEVASDEEGGNDEGDDVKAEEKPSRRVDTIPDEDEDDEVQAPSKPQRKIEDDDDDADTNGVKEADGADDEDEGAGEEEGAGDDDEDDEEEEDEDDEDVAARPRKRSRREGRNQFLDVEAEVDDEDEEEPEEDDDLQAEEPHPDDLLEGAGALDERRHRELDRKRELEASMDAEKQAAALKERYGRSRATAALDADVTPQRLLLPSVDDPTIWGIRVKPGKERDVVWGIMNRVQGRANTTEPIQIFSAFERGGSTMAGFVYVEARKVEHVIKAAEGIQFAYLGSKPTLVPITEMPDLLHTTKSKQIEPGMYVRIRRPALYQGDLAQIEDVETNGTEVTVRIVPRLTYGLNEDVNGPQDAKRKRPGVTSGGPRPPQRAFNENEAKKNHKKFLSQPNMTNRKHWVYRGDTYINGLLIKDMKINMLQTENVNPTLEEVTKFASGADDGNDELDLAALAATIKANTVGSQYVPGDVVEIYSGEQQGIVGKIVAVNGDIASMEVTDGDMRGQTIDAPVRTLRKMFRDGDHVKVIGGSKYHDEIGMVVKVKDDKVTLLTDANNQEITVFSKDLREANESAGLNLSSKYDLHDLVQLDAATVACVIKVDRESLRVLDQSGSVRSILPSQISNKLEKRRHAVATDRDGSEIRHDDTVKEYSGEQKQGRILHIHRGFLFILNRQIAENGGLFVTRSTNVATVAAKGGRVNAGPDLTKMNPALQRAPGGAAPMMPPPKPFGRDKLMGKTVTVRRGPYKALLGIVKDTTDTTARVELHTKNKVIEIQKEWLSVKDPVTGQSIQYDKYGKPTGTPARSGPGGMPSSYGNRPASRAPGWGGSTPAPASNGGRTPAWNQNAGNRTPAWQAGAGGRTPAWNRGNDGSRTVNPYADGSRTAYGGGDGGRTPAWGGASAWNANRTPYGGSHGYSDGSKTPAYGANDSGSRTPAWSSQPTYRSAPTPAASAPTPGAYNAPTPGASSHQAPYNAPTPGGPGGYSAPTPAAAPTPYDAPTPGYSAPTPGAVPYGSTPAVTAPTPGGYAETPGAWGAPTPAAGGGDEDDDPRYE